MGVPVLSIATRKCCNDSQTESVVSGNSAKTVI